MSVRSNWIKRKKQNKLGNKEVTDLCSYGFSHRSKLERAVCDLIAWEEKAGVTVHLAHEDTQYLTEARYRYIPDFKVQNCATSEIYWIEAKGFADKRWPTTKKLWRFSGPGRLRIIGGTYANLKTIETIVPKKEMNPKHRLGMIKIGHFTIRECEHGGIWIAKSNGEGMQMREGATLDAFLEMLETFFREHM